MDTQTSMWIPYVEILPSDKSTDLQPSEIISGLK